MYFIMLIIESFYSYFLLRDRISTCDVDWYWKIVLEERRINGVVVSCGLVLYHIEQWVERRITLGVSLSRIS